MTHHIDLATIRLDEGAQAAEGRGCVMEWTARFAGLPVTDHPPCTSPVLTAFAIPWNDALPDEERQRLVPCIPRLVGTAGDDEADERRAWLAIDWLVRTFTVAWLRKAGLTTHADELAALPEIASADIARAAQPTIDAALEAASARAVPPVWGTVWDAAWAAAWAAGSAADSAAERDAASHARIALREAAWGTAWYAAGAAAWSLEARREAVAELTESAFALFDRMIDAKAPVRA